MKRYKTIIFLNLRFANFYSKDLFINLKKDSRIRLVAILDQQFKNNIAEHIAPYLDQIYFMPSSSKMGFLAEFEYKGLHDVVKTELESAEQARIVCTDEFNLINAGMLRSEFGLAGLIDSELQLFRDKLSMKEVLLNAEIRVPKFKQLEYTDCFQNLESAIGLPFVIKPLDSCGSHGVYVIRNQKDFDHFKQEVDDCKNFEVEEFIEGKLYHVDSLIKDHVVKFICANEYSFPNYEYTQGKVLASIPLNNESEISNRLIHFAKKCLQVLHANNMVNHMELFITNKNEIVFLEVSGRPPGGFLNLTHDINFGINLMDEDFFMQSGINVPVEKIKNSNKSFFALFPLLPGKIVNLINPKVQSKYDIKWNVSPGCEVKPEECQNIVGKAAHAIFYHSDEKILREDFESIKMHEAIEVIQA